jgi:cellulose synthase/poly-beta-1,6-N-acetylglucosamine synthase-like glycosyltransferase
MTWIDFVFFLYMFVGLYMLSLFLFLYLHGRKDIFSYPNGKIEPVSIVMPCYNEGEHIGKAIEALLNLDYPRDMIEIIVVDDKSKDNSAEIISKYAEKYSNVKLIVNSRNSGGAAEPTNIGIRASKYDYIAVADADSEPKRDALIKMIGFLQNDQTVGGVTCAVLSKEPKTFMQKLQAIEYAVIAANRKLLDVIDAVYVTPGPFALYRKRILIEVGLFDPKNLTQDIEIVWRLKSRGYKARMCLATCVYSATPKKFSKWWKQRVRWNIGGTQTLIQYRNYLFKTGMLGSFILPFFSFSLFLGLFGLLLFVYLMLRRLLVTYLTTRSSIIADTAIITLQDLSFTPSVLNYFGAVMFVFGLISTLFYLYLMRRHINKKHNVFNILFYLLIYLTIYPLIMVTGLFKLMRKTYTW